ncbi:MAG: hypothetical protein LW809_04130 [Vampirovibrionales bacterium]|jgi:hypothetical protein|nr:hypothetical protein [Vampirovibrionales bacterium]
MTSIYDLSALQNAYQNPYQNTVAVNPYAGNTGLGFNGVNPNSFAQSPTTQFGIPATSQFANQQVPSTLANSQGQQIGSITSFMPGFNNIPVTQGVAQPPSSPLPAFDYGGLNQINNPSPFSNMPYVTQVPLQGFYTLANGQTVSNTQYTAYLPSVIPGSITNLQQLSSLPAASPGSLGAILQLAGISPSIIGASSLNNSGSLIPPVYGLKT